MPFSWIYFVFFTIDFKTKFSPLLNDYKQLNLSYKILLSFTLPNNPKDPDLSYKTDLDLRDCFGRKNNSV